MNSVKSGAVAIFFMSVSLLGQTRALGQITLFFDDFNGPTLNGNWVASLPAGNSGSGNASSRANYIGAPNYGFETLSTNSVLRMTNILNNHLRVGWGSQTTYTAADFRYEARFNTLNQSPTTSIDGFFEIWIYDPANTNHYDIISPFGGSGSGDRRFFYGSGIDGVYQNPSFNYQNNTWYRLVLEAKPGSNLRGSLYDDNENELIFHVFNHGAAAYPSGFRIAISQAEDAPQAAYPVDVAVDFVRLTTSGGPPTISQQPQGQTVDVGSNVTFTVAASGAPPLSYQWRFNTVNLSGQTNVTLTLTNVQFTNGGNYSVLVTNNFGSILSSNAVLTVNRPPVANPQAVALDENASLTITLTGSDPDGNPLTYSLVSAPTNGTLSGVLPNLIYRPATNYFGPDSFVFKVNDGRLDSPSATVAITVRHVNQPPTAQSEFLQVPDNVSSPVVLAATDPDNDPLTYIVVTGPTNGVLSGTAPNLIYTPNASYTGPDSFVFKANDGKLDSNPAIIRLNVVHERTLFCDSFNGPTLDPPWQASLPAAFSGSGGTSSRANYIGPPNYAFQSLATISVLRLTNILNNHLRVGWGSQTTYTAADFRYEARFNTLNQSPTTSIDGFFEIWIYDPTNTNHYDIISPFGGSASGDRRFFYGSGIDGVYQNPSFNYQNNTWYRLVLEAKPGSNLRGSLYNDNGNELIFHVFNHGAAAYPSGLRIAISQAEDAPQAAYPVDVAVDFACLTTTGFPPTINQQPQSLTVNVGSSASFNVGADGTAPLAYQWRFNGTNIVGATNLLLNLSNVKITNAGLYSVLVTNAYGSVISSNALLTVNQIPVAQCVDVIVSAGTNCLAIGSVNNGSSDPDGDALTLTQSPAGPYPIGTNRVTLMVSDGRGGSNSCSAFIIVRDTTPPSLACPTNIVRTNDPNLCGAVVTFPLPAATDTCSAVTNIVCVPTSGSLFPVGTTTVHCTARDAAGNAGSCTFTVTVRDTQAPTITCPADIVVTNAHNAWTSVVTFSPTIADNCPGAGLPACSPASGSAFALGTNLVNCSAMDDAGNSSQCNFKITVLPGNKPPVPIIEVSPLVSFPGFTNLFVIAPNSTNAAVVFDGSKSYDPDDSTFNYYWYEGTNLFSTNVIATNVLALGTHDITLWLDDTFPLGTNSATVEVEVISPCGGVGILEAIVDGQVTVLGKNQRPLIATLEAACASFERGDIIPGINQLRAFQNKLRAQIAPLDTSLADILTVGAQSIIDALPQR